MAKIGELEVVVTLDNKQFRSKLKQTETGVKKAGTSMKGLGSIAAAGFALAVVGATKLVSAVADVYGEFEKFEAVLVNTLGSRSEAQQALADIESFAARTPFSVQELTGAFVKLANQGFKPTNDEMRKLGDLAASTGKKFDQLAEAVIDAQVGEFERLKEFGIRAKKQGDEVTFTFKGVTKTVKNTTTAIKEYVTSLGDAVGVSGSMEAISETLQGKISNLGDSWDSLLKVIGERWQDEMKAAVQVTADLVDGVKELVKIPLEKKLIDDIKVLTGYRDILKNSNITQEQQKAVLETLNRLWPEYTEQINKAVDKGENLDKIFKQIETRMFQLYTTQTSKNAFAETTDAVTETIKKLNQAEATLAAYQRRIKAGVPLPEQTVTETKSFGGQLQSVKTVIPESEVLQNQVDQVAQLRAALDTLIKKLAQTKIESEDWAKVLKETSAALGIVDDDLGAIEPTIDKYVEAIKRINEQHQKHIQKADLLGESLNTTTDYINTFESELVALISKGEGTETFFQNLVSDLRDLQQEFRNSLAPLQELQAKFVEFQSTTNKLSGAGLQKSKNALNDYADEATKRAQDSAIAADKYRQDYANSIGTMAKDTEGILGQTGQVWVNMGTLISDAAMATVDGIAQGMEAMFTIPKNAENRGALIAAAFLSPLADLAIQVGKIAVATGIAIGGIKKALQSLNPVVAIAAGLALIALGSLVKGALSKATTKKGSNSGPSGSEYSGFSDNLPSFAQGGITNGPTLALVGDNPSGREFIIPSEKMGGILDGMKLSTTLRGNDILLASQRSDKRRNLTL